MEPLRSRGLDRMVNLMMDKVGTDVPCVNSVGATNWLNRPDVRKALHIEPSLGKWEICADLPYTRVYQDQVYAFNTLSEFLTY